jgi:steroid delta-isomerase-like uncharacterized protein
MSAENKNIVRRFIEEFQIGAREEAALELMAEDFVDRSPIGEFSPDRDGVIQLHRMLRGAFGILDVEIHDQISEDDRVATRKTIRGTHSGTFMGVAATGRQVGIGVIDVLRLKNGRLAEHWCEVDFAGLMGQIAGD